MTFYWSPLSPSGAAEGLRPERTTRFQNIIKNGELSSAGYIYGLFGINMQKSETRRCSYGLWSSAKFLVRNDFNPTASFQYEYPNMMMSATPDQNKFHLRLYT